MLFWFGYLLFSFFSLVGIASGNKEEEISRSCALVLLFLIVYGIDFFSRYKKSGILITGDLFFVVFYSLFHFSYIIPYSFGLIDADYEVLYDMKLVSKAVYFSLLCVSLFLVAYRLPTPKSQLPAMSFQPQDYGRLFKLSIYVLFLAIFLFWLPIAVIWKVAFSDYKALIEIGSVSPLGKLFWLSQYVGYFGVAIYFVSKAYAGRRVLEGKSTVLPFIFMGGYFFIGDRGGFISFFFIFLFCWSVYQGGPKIKNIILGFAVIAFLSRVVAATRTQSIYNPLEMLSYFFSLEGSESIWDFFHEFGSSLKTVVIALYYVPSSHGFWLGESYVNSFATVIPNFLGTREVSGAGSFITEVAFGSLEETYGRGGSIAMEAYLNFGYWGALMFIVFGAYLKATYQKFLYSKSVISSVVFLSSIGGFSMWMRNTSSVSFRIIIWSLIGTVLLTIISNSFRSPKYVITNR